METKKMNSRGNHQPHDHLVKKLLSNPAATRDILNLYLPKDVLNIIDLNHLELQRDSFIDDEHRAFAVDLLFKTTFQRDEGYIWVLIEHQRKSDPWLPVRIFKYVAIIWDHLRVIKKNKKIPLVYPLIIYNGDKPYAHSLTLSDLIEPDASKSIFSGMFTTPFCLIDLSVIEDEALRQSVQNRVKGIALLMALKHVYDKDLQTFFEQMLVGVLKQLERIGDIDEVVDVLYYLLNEGEFLDIERFWRILHQEFSPKIEDRVMTIAQKLEQKGKELGKEEGKLEVAKRLLAERPELSKIELIAWIQRMTGLSTEKIWELEKN